MTANHKSSRRRLYLVDPAAQTRWILKTGGASAGTFLACLLCVVVASVAGIWSYESYSQAELTFRRQLGYLANALTVPIVMALVVFCHACLRETFRVLGPLHRHRLMFQSIKRRVLPRGLKIRNGDQLQDHTACLNETLEQLHDDVAALQVRAISALQKAEALSGDKSSGLRNELRELVDLLQQYELDTDPANPQSLESMAIATAGEAEAKMVTKNAPLLRV